MADIAGTFKLVQIEKVPSFIGIGVYVPIFRGRRCAYECTGDGCQNKLLHKAPIIVKTILAL